MAQGNLDFFCGFAARAASCSVLAFSGERLCLSCCSFVLFLVFGAGGLVPLVRFCCGLLSGLSCRRFSVCGLFSVGRSLSVFLVLIFGRCGVVLLGRFAVGASCLLALCRRFVVRGSSVPFVLRLSFVVRAWCCSSGFGSVVLPPNGGKNRKKNANVKGENKMTIIRILTLAIEEQMSEKNHCELEFRDLCQKYVTEYDERTVEEDKQLREEIIDKAVEDNLFEEETAEYERLLDALSMTDTEWIDKRLQELAEKGGVENGESDW